MDFDLTDDERRFRTELCEFLTHELTDGVWRTERDPNEQDGWSVAFIRRFRRRLGEAGYIGMGWPAAYGGGGRSTIYTVLFAEEMEYHRAPGLDRSITYVPLALLTFGTEQQKREFLPRIRRGELSWFVGYSEPESGSDLASLQTRAVDHGDYFVLTGQKAFSSQAHMADYGWVAARTDPDAPKHRGISLFIVDMRSPGVQISPHRTVAGWEHHSVYFDNVRVPRSMLVGELDAGWRVIMGAIDFERSALGSPGLADQQLDRLLQYATSVMVDGEHLAEDAAVRDRLIRLMIETEAARLMSYWVASMHARGMLPQHETSLAALYKRETVRQLDIAALEMLGPFGALGRESPWARLGGDIDTENRDHLYFHFAAGGFDITRNVIAQRGLGLPR